MYNNDHRICRWPICKERESGKLFSIQKLHIIISNSNTWWHIKIWSYFWNVQGGGSHWNAKWKLTVDFCQNLFRVFLYFENKLEFSFYFLLRFWQKTSHSVLNSTFRRPRSSNETLISLEVKTNPRYSKFFSACSKSRKVQSEVFCQKEVLAHVNVFALQ